MIVISFFNALICAFVHMALFRVNNEDNVVKKRWQLQAKHCYFCLVFGWKTEQWPSDPCWCQHSPPINLDRLLITTMEVRLQTVSLLWYYNMLTVLLGLMNTCTTPTFSLSFSLKPWTLHASTYLQLWTLQFVCWGGNQMGASALDF